MIHSCMRTSSVWSLTSSFSYSDLLRTFGAWPASSGAGAGFAAFVMAAHASPPGVLSGSGQRVISLHAHNLTTPVHAAGRTCEAIQCGDLRLRTRDLGGGR